MKCKKSSERGTNPISQSGNETVIRPTRAGPRICGGVGPRICGGRVDTIVCGACGKPMCDRADPLFGGYLKPPNPSPVIIGPLILYLIGCILCHTNMDCKQ
ncbi:hypothetical protein TSUD_04440 [Trifolium subterraneum]|nr:hypothetical protein TSUD_04440 [Trifolium subterraneum]